MLKYFSVSFLFFTMNFTAVYAAPFCVLQAGITPQCFYNDVMQCRKNMTSNGTCILNPETHVTYRGGMYYCVIQSNLIAECNYIDRSQCNDEARLNGSICIENPDKKKSGAEMYDYDSRIQR